MAQSPNLLSNILSNAAKAAENIDVDAIRDGATQVGDAINSRAGELRDAAGAARDAVHDKLTELDRMLEQSITEYNDAYTLMNDKGVRLYIERQRSSDVISITADLVNSIANHPKAFDDDFDVIDTGRKQFNDSCAYAERELLAARQAAGGAGAGLAAGASVAFMAPTAAMWVATTFGTASTGTAIATLSGAAATNAALAWLGGGTLAAGGSGIAGGTALLALAGPIGWTIAGASLLSSIVLFASNRQKLNKQKNEEIESVKRNTERVKELDVEIGGLLEQTEACRATLLAAYSGCLPCYGKDYSRLDSATKHELGAMVNDALALSKLFEKTVG